MNYELAKKLKEANYDFSKSPTVYNDDIGCQTLPELISACGDKFILVGINTTGLNDYPFMSQGLVGDDTTIDTPYIDFGNSPEEAVTNLWIALNKK